MAHPGQLGRALGAGPRPPRRPARRASTLRFGEATTPHTERRRGWTLLPGPHPPREHPERRSDCRGRESFTPTARTAVAITIIHHGAGDPMLRVTHDHHPSPATLNPYEATVILENVSDAPPSDLRYTRAMNHDIAPMTLYELVTIHGVSAANLPAVTDGQPGREYDVYDPSANDRVADCANQGAPNTFTFAFASVGGTTMKQPAGARVRAPGFVSRGNEGTPLRFDIMAEAPDGDELTFLLDRGDGTSTWGTRPNIPEVSSAHAYGTPGARTVTLCITDKDGGVVATSIPVNVRP